MLLTELPLNQASIISQLPKDANLHIALLEQGFFIGADIHIAHRAPFKGSLAVHILGSTVCISQTLAAQIEVSLA